MYKNYMSVLNDVHAYQLGSVKLPPSSCIPWATCPQIWHTQSPAKTIRSPPCGLASVQQIFCSQASWCWQAALIETAHQNANVSGISDPRETKCVERHPHHTKRCTLEACREFHDTVASQCDEDTDATCHSQLQFRQQTR